MEKRWQPYKLTKMLEESAERNISSTTLPQLAREVLDMITLSSFNIPLLHVPETPNYALVVQDVFTSPFFRVNRSCRRSAIYRLVDNFVWIEVISHKDNSRPFGKDSIFYQVAVLDERFLDLLPGNRTAIQFTIDPSERMRPSLTIRRCVFPYQSESVLRFIVQWLHHCGGTFLSVQVSFNDYSATSVIGKMLS